MLSDLERKLLRVLSNYNLRTHRMPTKAELERMIGRRYADIEHGLSGLVEKEYIFWPDRPALETIVILEAWERDVPTTPKPRNRGNNVDYFMNY
ncbi:hypothetical protein V3851_24040 [Paenibacillus sp. M1]|uniref:Phage protein n=1 Tax=Paenibacillus haidiansis TaxID=1574488 RepID=A0ABU7VYM9_9BACL